MAEAKREQAAAAAAAHEAQRAQQLAEASRAVLAGLERALDAREAKLQDRWARAQGCKVACASRLIACGCVCGTTAAVASLLLLCCPGLQLEGAQGTDGTRWRWRRRWPPVALRPAAQGAGMQGT